MEVGQHGVSGVAAACHVVEVFNDEPVDVPVLHHCVVAPRVKANLYTSHTAHHRVQV